MTKDNSALAALPAPAWPLPSTPAGRAALQAAAQGAQARAAQCAQQWRGRQVFTVLALHWDQGLDWLATWAAWRADPDRCHTLVWVVVSPDLAVDVPTAPWADNTLPTQQAMGSALRGESKGDTACETTPVFTVLGGDPSAAHSGDLYAKLWAQLQALWPPATPDLHALHFEAGRVQLQLAPGTAGAWWPQLRLQADVLYLPTEPPAGWGGLPAAKALARQAAAGARLCCRADWPPADAQALQTVGFDPQPSPTGLNGHWARYQPPAWRGTTAPALASTAPAARQALVLGAGLAGAATAHALAQQGWSVQVVDRLPGPAQATSGNPGGLFHGTAHGEDGLHARLLRAAALMAWRELAPRIAAGLPGQADGLLRVDAADSAPPNTQSTPVWPARWLQRLNREQASALVGLPLPAASSWFPSGGWVSPADLVKAWLTHPGIGFSGGLDVQSLAFVPAAGSDANQHEPGFSEAVSTPPQGHWQLLDGQGQVLAQAPVLVLAAAGGVLPLLTQPLATADVLQPQAGCAWPLGLQRGQVSTWAGATGRLHHPVAGGGGGYALPLPGGLLFGATTQRGDPDPQVRDSDHAHNLQRLQQLTGLQPPPGLALAGRVGWRLVSEDRLPVAGPVPTGQAPRFATQARAWPRAPGLFVCTGLGGRGLTLAPLLGQLVAAQVVGLPVPLPQRLVEAVDPARWLLKLARRAEGGAGR
jgi:tRNA 5-methylaminomethyl-2-thiouridine biosynthesis bifunctional protein